MAKTLLEVVKETPELYDLLKQGPSSKLVRSYLKQKLNLSSVPVLTTLAEWEAWLSSVELQTESYSKERKSHATTDYISLASNASVNAYQDRTYKVKYPQLKLGACGSKA